MPRTNVKCYEIPIEFGDHKLYILLAKTELAADVYLRRKFKVDVTYSGNNHSEASSYFVGHKYMLFMYIPPDFALDHIVHETTHVYKYMVNRMDTNPDEEGEAYIKQMLFKKIVDKLIEVNLLKIIYVK